ncbi:MAG: protein kinase [Acidobacteria bacterium]|nr:protein kinase [Acidobacteriota bacterium]
MEPGTRLGPYEIQSQLGAGGMGEVYLAQDARLGRQVAIKVLPEEYATDPERLARFEQEARAAAALNHPNIAIVHDVGESEGTHFIVQELLEGRSLREELADSQLKLERALALGAEVAAGLAGAHEAGIVHRDLKPDNIFVTPGGNAKVLAFGLAKLTEAAAGPDSGSMSPTALGTSAGQVMGTAGYMSPEQVDGSDVDRRADVFALGCVLYEMVAGRRAFAGKSLIDTLHAIAREEPTSLLELEPRLPVELQRIAGKCLEKDPADRYQHVGETAADLRALANEVRAGTALSGLAARGTSPSRGRLVDGGLGAALGLVAGLLGAALWLSSAPDGSQRVARRLQLPLPSDLVSVGGFDSEPVFSPDSQKLVFGGRTAETQPALWVREIDTGNTYRLEGTEDARYPFFSPDGRWQCSTTAPSTRCRWRRAYASGSFRSPMGAAAPGRPTANPSTLRESRRAGRWGCTACRPTAASRRRSGLLRNRTTPRLCVRLGSCRAERASCSASSAHRP